MSLIKTNKVSISDYALNAKFNGFADFNLQENN